MPKVETFPPVARKRGRPRKDAAPAVPDPLPHEVRVLPHTDRDGCAGAKLVVYDDAAECLVSLTLSRQYADALARALKAGRAIYRLTGGVKQ